MSTKDEVQQDIFINRELSWLEFNRRVLGLGKEKMVPLGEQLKFASIYASNLDEFFMVRVGSLYDRTLLPAHLQEAENKTNMTPQQQLHAIMPRVAELQQHCDKTVAKLYEALGEAGYRKVNLEKLTKQQAHLWKKYFLAELFPVLSPQIVDRRNPFPFLRGSDVYVGALLKGKKDTQTSFGLIPVSAHLGRLVFLPDPEGRVMFALVEELVLFFADLVLGKKAVQARCLFRVTRNADITVDEGMFDHDIDYRDVMSALLKRRRKLAAVRLQTSAKAPQEVVDFLCEKLVMPKGQVFAQTAPLDLSVGFKLSARLSTDGNSQMFYPVRRPIAPPREFSLTQEVRRHDMLVQYPYQSMRPFLDMLRRAALDPDVISIKMTLYRVARDSQIIEALCAAAESGKEVVTVVELRARFDEQNNIDFSKQLEEAGCTVIYGFADYKVHSKLCLIARKSAKGVEYITQVGTGNYNEKTSELYTDLSFLTSDHAVGEELAVVFQNLATEQLTEGCGRLLLAPLCFKSELMREMDAEIEAARLGRPARIVLKCNSISDKEIIEKLAEASMCGVPVQMIVRGICCIKAGVPGLTEHVSVRSLVGRYLEHARVYAFGAKENLRVYIASGDFLTRNTQRRVEAGVRVADAALVAQLYALLELQLRDNVNAYEMQPDGTYSKIKAAHGALLVDSQLEMYRVLEHAWPQQAPVAARAAHTRHKEDAHTLPVPSAVPLAQPQVVVESAEPSAAVAAAQAAESVPKQAESTAIAPVAAVQTAPVATKAASPAAPTRVPRLIGQAAPIRAVRRTPMKPNLLQRLGTVLQRREKKR